MKITLCLLDRVHLREAIYPFSPESMVSIGNEQNIICSKTHLEDTTHEQTNICRQLFAGHVVGSQSMKRNEKNKWNENVNDLAGRLVV